MGAFFGRGDGCGDESDSPRELMLRCECRLRVGRGGWVSSACAWGAGSSLAVAVGGAAWLGAALALLLGGGGGGLAALGVLRLHLALYRRCCGPDTGHELLLDLGHCGGQQGAEALQQAHRVQGFRVQGSRGPGVRGPGFSREGSRNSSRVQTGW